MNTTTANLYTADLLESALKAELASSWEALQKASALATERWTEFGKHKGRVNEHQFPGLLETAMATGDTQRARELSKRQSALRAAFAMSRTALVQSLHVLNRARDQFSRTVMKTRGALTFCTDPHMASALAGDLLMYVEQAKAINDKFIERSQRESNSDTTEGAAWQALRNLYREVADSRALGGMRNHSVETDGIFAISFPHSERQHPLADINARLVAGLEKLQRGAKYHEIWGWSSHLNPLDWEKTLANYRQLKANLSETRYASEMERALASGCSGASVHMIAIQNSKRGKLAQARRQILNLLSDAADAANELGVVFHDLLKMDVEELKYDKTDVHNQLPHDIVVCNVVLADALCKRVCALCSEWEKEQRDTAEQAQAASKSLLSSLDEMLSKGPYKGLSGLWSRRVSGSDYQYHFTEPL